MNPGCRSGHTVTTFCSHHVLFGGLVHCGDKEVCSGDAYYLDGETLRWRVVEAKGWVEEVFAHSAVVGDGGELVVFGGMTNGGEVTDQLAVLKGLGTHDARWERIGTRCSKTPSSRWGHSGVRVPFKSEMIIFGGMTKTGALNDVWLYKHNERQWKQLEVTGEAPSGRRRHTATVYKSTMYVFGGRDADGTHFNDFYGLDLGTLCWTKYAAQGVRPAPRVGHAAAVVGDSLVIYGGSSVQASLDAGYRVHSDVYVAVLHKLSPGGKVDWKRVQQDLPSRTMSAAFAVNQSLYIYGGRDTTRSHSSLFSVTLPKPPKRSGLKALSVNQNITLTPREKTKPAAITPTPLAPPTSTTTPEEQKTQAPDSPFSSFAKERMKKLSMVEPLSPTPLF